MLGTILLIFVVLMLVGTLPTWRHSRSWGYAPSGGLGSVILVASVLGLALQVSVLSAEETTGEKIQTKTDDATRSTKKTYRALKKKARDATGNQSIKEDLKDGAKNVGDSVEDAGKKIKRKVD